MTDDNRTRLTVLLPFLKEYMNNIILKISRLLTLIVRFIIYDIWRITGHEVRGFKGAGIFVAKSIILAVRGFTREDLMTKASALTFNTLLALVPLLAVIIGVSGGFGLSESVRQDIVSWFPGQSVAIESALGFADSYLSVARNGLFISIGVVLLLYTVVNLISTIENTFNEIWQLKKDRSWRRKITDYLAFLIILPTLISVSSALSLFLKTVSNTFLSEYVFLTPVANSVLKIAPYFITTLFFTALYILIPNTKVKFPNALAAGAFTGIVFQVFQLVYISGQIWVSKYNAIYGTFAALPLLLLWLQLSWLLALFGAELAYSSQNVKKYDFERDSADVSRRYRDFLTVLIASLIVKRFEKENAVPYTADELSDNNRIPIRLTTEILNLLSKTGVLSEMRDSNDGRIIRYQPSTDAGLTSVGSLLRKIDEDGSENFKIDKERRFFTEWGTVLNARSRMYRYANNLLLKDL